MCCRVEPCSVSRCSTTKGKHATCSDHGAVLKVNAGDPFCAKALSRHRYTDPHTHTSSLDNMPKGKRKDKNPHLYLEEGEDEDVKATRAARSLAPQAKAHARGGVHRVDENKLTGTVWDHASRIVMRNAAEGKNADGQKTPEFQKYKIFFAHFKKVKDLKKDILLETLGHAERVLAREVKEQQRKGLRLVKDAERQRKAEESKRQEEERRKHGRKLEERKAGILVTDSEEDESDSIIRRHRQKSPEQVECQQIDQRPEQYPVQSNSAASDSSDTTTTQSLDSDAFSSSKLHLFEWWHPDLPSSKTQWNSRHFLQNAQLQCKEIRYVSLHVIGINTKEPLRLPGRNHWQKPDSVPVLSGYAKNCARNGVLVDKLVGARIESGTEWARRTFVQGWNGRMYFDLPDHPEEESIVIKESSANLYPSENDLATIYRTWKKHRRLERKNYSGVHKTDPRLQRFRLSKQRELVKSVYEFSRWRPRHLGFLPAYLGAPEEQPEDETMTRRDIESLFYVVLENEQVPSFYFWADSKEWANPIKRNPEFAEYEGLRRQSFLSPQSRRELSPRTSLWRRISSFSRQSKLARITVTSTPRKFLLSTKIPETSAYKAAVWAIERDLYNHGLEATLQNYQKSWVNEGKTDAWAKLTRILSQQLPPSGFPAQPPIRYAQDLSMISVAEKMARVQVPSETRPVIPIFVQDDWTRNDDAYWITVRRQPTTSPVEHNAVSKDRRNTQSTKGSPRYLSRKISDVFTWLSLVTSPMNEFCYERALERQIEQETDLALYVMMDRSPTSIPQHNLWKMMQERYQIQRWVPWLCAICFDELGNATLEDYEQHIIDHMVHIARMCPFCDMAWYGLDGEDKVEHVMRHRTSKDGNLHAKRKLTLTPPELQGWTAIPRRLSDQRRPLMKEITISPQTPSELRTGAAIPRELSSYQQSRRNKSFRRPGVRLSSNVVGRRVAYNDRITSPTGTKWDPKSSTRRFHSRDSYSQYTLLNPSIIPKGPAKVNFNAITDSNGHRMLECNLTDTDLQYQNAHDPRRRQSSASPTSAKKGLVPYTYVDRNVAGIDRDWEENERPEGLYMARSGVTVRERRAKKTMGMVGNGGDVESGGELNGARERDMNPEVGDDDYSYSPAAGLEGREETSSGYPISGSSSQGYSIRRQHRASQADDFPPPRKRQCTTGGRDTGLTGHRISEQDEPLAPSQYCERADCPCQRSQEKHKMHFKRKSDRYDSINQEWMVPVPLWSSLMLNPAVKTSSTEASPSDVDSQEEHAELTLEERDAIDSIKTARGEHHVPRNNADVLNITPSQPAHRSTTPSPTISLARSGLKRRSTEMPPNTPAVRLGENPLEFDKNLLSRPANPGWLKSKIASVKMIRNGPSGERPSAFDLGESRSKSKIPSSSSRTSTERNFESDGDPDMTATTNSKQTAKGKAVSKDKKQHSIPARKSKKELLKRPSHKSELQAPDRVGKGKALKKGRGKVTDENDRLEEQRDGSSNDSNPPTAKRRSLGDSVKHRKPLTEKDLLEGNAVDLSGPKRGKSKKNNATGREKQAATRGARTKKRLDEGERLAAEAAQWEDWNARKEG